MNELLYIFVLLMPIAWYFGYRNGRSRNIKTNSAKQRGLSKTYFAGLNYLLNEESDKAIDAFVSMLELDSETVEIQLALGNLFRKKGEVDRAIRIHQNLIARPSLPPRDRKFALCELGYDYMAAGLLDRAENIFQELSRDPEHKESSLSQLLVIYQQTNDWKKAIEAASKLSLPMNESCQKEVSHFYCELAEEAINRSNYKDAKIYIKKAILADEKCVRASLISANIYISNGDYKLALKSYQKLTTQDIDFLPEAIGSIIHCYGQLDDEKGLEKYLEVAIQRGGGISSILAYAKLLKSNLGDRQAAEFIAVQMDKHPSLKGLLKLIELHRENATESAKPSLTMLYNVVDKLLKNKPIYHCDHCGFDSKTMFWQCPSCKCWGKVKPITGIEGE